MKINLFNQSQFYLYFESLIYIFKKNSLIMSIFMQLFDVSFISISDFHHLLNSSFLLSIFFLIKFVGNNILKLPDKSIEIVDIFTSSKKILNVCNSCNRIVFMSYQSFHKNCEHILDIFFLTVL